MQHSHGLGNKSWSSLTVLQFIFNSNMNLTQSIVRNVAPSDITYVWVKVTRRRYTRPSKPKLLKMKLFPRENKTCMMIQKHI